MKPSLFVRAATGVAFMTVAALAGCGNDKADDDGAPADTFAPDPPSVYVAKVKNILVGQAPTDDEIAQVTADPTAIGTLIDGWMQLPEYQQKMMVFFELAFQQTQISEADFVDLVPTNGLGVGKGVPLLVQNARESFARTVLELTAAGQPLNAAFTTHQFMMTPALMELYAFMDTRPVNDTAAVTDTFAKANPSMMITMETAAGPIAFADSINPKSANYMHWYSPDVAGLTYPDPTCSNLDPIAFKVNAQALHALLYGEIPNHPGPSGNCGNRSGSVVTGQIDPTDFTAWKMVTVRSPKAGEARTTFYDLPSLRTATELVLDTPHVGFFSTPAFFANWPTNASNQMRVTANQSLIVATGTAVDGQDTTAPQTTPGLDAVHAAPGTACFGCHQQLDPTRSILSSTYSWFYYPQTDQTLVKQPGLFAFQDVIAPMTTIDSFAQLLATHPLVGQAWAQKLCYYVNSAPCNPIDPEFLRILDVFNKAGGTWSSLVHELLASPLTTNVSETATTKTNGEVIAVSRRDHLCAALNNRLGFVDICQLDSTMQGRAVSSLAQIISGMPSDGYGRGATIPVLPNQPTLFYRAGLENVCAQVSAMVIDTKPSAQQPGSKQWSSAQPDAAIADFVALLMAMPPSDPRAAQATTILRSHFDASVQAGATSKDALASTFVAACLSPSFIGIGM
ncbi:MAG TPA: hypothetical protein VH165_36750 [Kofleriaceae bacterium]|jgi:hypothetical protein|nr:hypothetical protein [Kofleriaceae bacterium]